MNSNLLDNYDVKHGYAPRVNADGVWQDLPTVVAGISSIDAIQGGRKLPSEAEMSLEEYCHKGALPSAPTQQLRQTDIEDIKKNYPLAEDWCSKHVCPGCDEESLIAFDDYICFGCRYA